MFQGTWLRKLPARTLPRRRTARVQVGLYRSAVHLIGARVRIEAGRTPVVEQLKVEVIVEKRNELAFARLAASGIFRQAPAIVALAPDQYSTHPLPAPLVPEDEMCNTLRWQLREVLPYSPEDALIAYVRLSGAQDGGAPAGLLVVAAQRSAVGQAVAPLLAAGVEVAAVDVPEMAQRNLLAQLPGAASGQAMLSLDSQSGLLTVIAQRELCFSRRIQLPRSDASDEEDPEHLAMRVATQIQRSVEVVERQSGLAPVRTVWIGPHPYSALISRCTAEQTGIDCPQLDLQAEIRFAAPLAELDADKATGTLLAIGAALRSEESGESGDAAATPGWLERFKSLRTAA